MRPRLLIFAVVGFGALGLALAVRGQSIDFAVSAIGALLQLAGPPVAASSATLSEHEMEEINPSFAQADICLVVGANDVTNPAARSDKSSPLYGMPILEVDRARSIIVLKRSMRPGFAGVDNDLYYNEKCMMLFGDAKVSITKLIGEMKSLL